MTRQGMVADEIARPGNDLSAGEQRATLHVVLVSFHALVGEAVRTALASRGVLAVVPLRGMGRRAVEHLLRDVDASKVNVGLILCDIDDPVQLRATIRIASGVPIRWLLLTSSLDEARWGAAIEGGVRSILPMSERIDNVAHVTRMIARGRDGLSDVVRDRVIEAWHRAGDEHRQLVERMGTLTPREMRVLGLLASGFTVREISERSEVTQATVRSQVKSVLRKLGVNSQLAAVAAHRQVMSLGGSFRRDRGGADWEG